MNFDKAYVNDSCSELEARWNGLFTTSIPFQAAIFINPGCDRIMGKTIILPLPLTNLDIKKLTRFNHVISRYPLPDSELSYEFKPYDLNEVTSSSNKEYSLKILNKYLLTSDRYRLPEGDKYLLATDIETNGYLNMTGYILLNSII